MFCFLITLQFSFYCNRNLILFKLYHVIPGEFFRDQFESKLQQYQEDVNTIIEAQKDHVRRIVHTAIQDDASTMVCIRKWFFLGSLANQSKRKPNISNPTKLFLILV